MLAVGTPSPSMSSELFDWLFQRWKGAGVWRPCLATDGLRICDDLVVILAWFRWSSYYSLHISNDDPFKEKKIFSMFGRKYQLWKETKKDWYKSSKM